MNGSAWDNCLMHLLQRSLVCFIFEEESFTGFGDLRRGSLDRNLGEFVVQIVVFFVDFFELLLLLVDLFLELDEHILLIVELGLEVLKDKGHFEDTLVVFELLEDDFLLAHGTGDLA
jgi:hypothetical protein